MGIIYILRNATTHCDESDLVGSTALAATMTPIDTCILLHDLYTRWDSLAAEIGGIVKVTTIGDAYIAVSGPSFADHGIMSGITKEKGALLAVRMACSMMEEAGRVQAIRNQKLTEMVEEEDEETTVVLGDDDIENLNFLKTTADSVQASRSSDLSDKQGTETPSSGSSVQQRLCSAQSRRKWYR